MQDKPIFSHRAWQRAMRRSGSKKVPRAARRIIPGLTQPSTSGLPSDPTLRPSKVVERISGTSPTRLLNNWTFLGLSKCPARRTAPRDIRPARSGPGGGSPGRCCGARPVMVRCDDRVVCPTWTSNPFVTAPKGTVGACAWGGACAKGGISCQN